MAGALGLLVVLVVFVAGRVERFWTYPTATQFIVKTERPVPFPAVTVCGNNFAFASRIASANETALTESPLDEDLRDLGVQPDELVIECMFGGRKCSGIHAEEWMHPTFGVCLTFNGGQRPFRVGGLMYDRDALHPGETDLDYLSARSERVGDQGPTAEEVAAIRPAAGRLSSKTSRADDGFSLYLGVFNEEYLSVGDADEVIADWDTVPTPGSFASESAGMRIAVHERFKTPDMDTAVVLEAGTETHLPFTKRVLSRQPPPWGTCSPRFWDEKAGAPAPSGNYSVASCELQCVAQLIETKCGCYTTPTPRGHTPAPGLKPCSRAAACIFDQEDAILLGTVACPACVRDCREIEYQSAVSSLAWPALASQQTFLEVFERKAATGIGGATFANLTTRQDGVRVLRENVLLARIYPATTTYEEVTTVRAYELTALLSDIGGQAGLWGGISVLTAVEVVELVVMAALALAGVTCASRTFSHDEEADAAAAAKPSPVAARTVGGGALATKPGKLAVNISPLNHPRPAMDL